MILRSPPFHHTVRPPGVEAGGLGLVAVRAEARAGDEVIEDLGSQGDDEVWAVEDRGDVVEEAGVVVEAQHRAAVVGRGEADACRLDRLALVRVRLIGAWPGSHGEPWKVRATTME